MSQGPEVGVRSDERQIPPDFQGNGQQPSRVSVSFQIGQALSLLLQGCRYAEATGRSIWDYAVEIQDLKNLGLTSNDLRWMVCQDWVEHGGEVSLFGEVARGFEPECPLSFSPRSCFVLKDKGLVQAARLSAGDVSCRMSELESASKVAAGLEFSTVNEVARPQWDFERHRLYVGGVLVKEFKLPCPNQGTVLMAFEEEKWPARIDDPLPPNGDTDARTRLSSTIKSLNKYQRRRLIHFMGDGTGEGVMWEFVGRNGSDRHLATRTPPQGE
jgi:hypothetical protein